MLLSCATEGPRQRKGLEERHFQKNVPGAGQGESEWFMESRKSSLFAEAGLFQAPYFLVKASIQNLHLLDLFTTPTLQTWRPILLTSRSDNQTLQLNKRL